MIDDNKVVYHYPTQKLSTIMIKKQNIKKLFLSKPKYSHAKYWRHVGGKVRFPPFSLEPTEGLTEVIYAGHVITRQLMKVIEVICPPT